MQPRGQQNIWALPADVRQRMFDEERKRRANPNQTYSAERPEVIAQNKKQVPQELSFAQKALPVATSAIGGILGGVLGGGVLSVPLAAAGAGIGGAVGKGIVELTDEREGVSGKEIAKEGAYGVAGGLLGPVLGKVVGKPVSKAAGAVGGKAYQKFVANMLKASPTKMRAFAEEIGDPGTVLKELYPEIGSPTVGTGGLEGFKSVGGTIKKSLKVREDIIQSTIQEAEKSGVKFGADDFIAALQVKRAELAKLSTNATKIKQLDDIIDKTQKLYSKGISPKQLLDIKRVVDKKWGKAVIEEEKGAIATQVEKEFANIARAKLKRTFGDIGNALDDESKLLAIEGIYKDAVAKGATGGFGEVSINPLSWVNKIANSQMAAEKGVGKAALEQTSPRLVSQIFKKAAAQSAVRILAPDATQKEAEEYNTLNKFSTNLDQVAQMEQDLMNQVGQLDSDVANTAITFEDGSTITKENIQQMYLNDLTTTGGKNIDKIAKFEDRIFKEQTAKKVSAEVQKQTIGLAASSLAIDQAEQLIAELNPGEGVGQRALGFLRKGKGAIGEDAAASSYEAWRRAMIGFLARSTAGQVGSLSDTDVARAEGWLPKLTDTAEEAARKLANARAFIQARQQALQYSPQTMSSGQSPILEDGTLAY